MRDKLVKAWLTVLSLWWLSTAFVWSLSNARLQHTAQVLHAAWPALWPLAPKHVTALNAWKVLAGVLVEWSVPMLVVGTLTTVAAAAGLAGVLGGRATQHKTRHETGDVEAGLSVNIGALPRPVWAAPRAKNRAVNLSGSYAERIHALPAVYADLLRALLAYLRDQPDAYVGPGHQGTLLDHSMHVLVQALDRSQGAHQQPDPLLLIGAVAHDAGKTLAWRKTAGEWQRTGDHDTLSARLVSSFPEFLALPLAEQRTLLLLLAYGHKAARTPTAEGVDPERLHSLMEALHAADRTATREEKKQTLATVDLPSALRTAFQTALSRIEFQRPGIKKGARAVGWRRDNRVFLLEPGFRQALLAVLPEDVTAAMGGDYRPKGGLAQVTTALLDTLRAAGWLVEESDGMRASPPLWRMKSGEKEFAGVIVVDLPDALLPALPANTPFPLSLTAPLFPSGPTVPGATTIKTKTDDGGVPAADDKQRRLLQATLAGAASAPSADRTARIQPKPAPTIDAACPVQPSPAPTNVVRFPVKTSPRKGGAAPRTGDSPHNSPPDGRNPTKP